MLVADNRAYKYEDHIYDLPSYDEKESQVKKKSREKKSKGHIFSLFVIFSFSIIMISRYACIAEIGFNINKLENEYEETMKENSLLKVKLSKSINLQVLEEMAQEELSMQYPESDQIVYVSIDKNSITKEKLENESYFFPEDVAENKYIAKVKTIVNSITALFY